MNGKKIFKTLVFAILAIAIGYGVYKYSPMEIERPEPLDHPHIDLNEEDRVLYLKGGFAITGEQTRFFNNKGLEIAFPFTFSEEESIEELSITAMSDNYVLINEKDIYRLEDNTLDKIYSLEDKAYGIDEVGEDIILMMGGDDNILYIKGFDTEHLALRDLIPKDEDFFIDYDIDNSSSSLSILTLNAKEPFPISQVYHLGDDFNLFGAISHNDEPFYRIFRFPERAILIGNQRVLCYNIEGDLEWELENLGYDNLIVSKNDSGLLIYSKLPFPNPDDGEEEKEYNGLYIRGDGEQRYMEMPKQISKISAYENRFICVQYDKNVLIMNNRGRVIKEYVTDEYIRAILCNPHEPKYLYLVHGDNRLQIYSTIEEEND